MSDLTFKVLQVVLASGLFYLAFIGWFSNKTCFRLNRCYLLTALVVSLSVPFLHFTSTSSSLVQRVITLEEVMVTASATSVTPSVHSPHWLYFIYLFVALVLLLKMVVGLVSIYFITRKSETHTFKDQKVYVSSKNVNPFSIFRCIVISQATFANKETLSRIIIHEQSHIAQGHGVDVLCYELICAIGWINPFFWLLKKEIKSTHEYLADEKVIEHGFDLAKYFMLIFDNIIGANVGLANNFNQSLNLKRMKMMKKKRTSFAAKMMSAIALPVVFVAVLLVTVQCTNNSTPTADLADNESPTSELAQDEISEITVVGYGKATSTEEVPPMPEMTETDVVVSEETAPEEQLFMVVEKMPSFPGGEKAMMKYLSQNVRYPAEAQENGVQGRVKVEFVVNKDGSISDVGILKGVASTLDEEAMRVVRNMPAWTPGQQRGKNVRVSYRIPINFTMR